MPAELSADCLRQIAPFLVAADRFRLAQVCRTARQVVYCQEFEIAALEEWLRLGAPSFPTEGKPFTRPSDDPRVLLLRSGACRAAMRTWHLVAARFAAASNEMERCGLVSARIAIAPLADAAESLCNDGLFVAAGSETKDVAPLVRQSIKTRDSLHTETEAWDIAHRIIESEFVCRARRVVPSALAAVALLKCFPEHRNDCVQTPRLLEEWATKEGTIFPVSRVSALAKLSSASELSFQDFFSWKFIVREDQDQSVSGDVDIVDQCRPWLGYCMERFIKACKLRGFQPYVDSVDGCDTTGSLTYIKVNYQYDKFTTPNYKHLILRGKNKATLYLTV
eukprot:Protomagalhaensia_wolfi_Nauph_80__6142@NODE_894_length_1905_cov_129_463558_g673_i0_p1_GENE_NODE_894_length_1905_cov_129_463558_g673_i0NODE_894_length_1905_cov_129_463558_g673_i0_p1_ORF_typecomplete_len336_score42_86Fbox/PF00646_33/0_0054Fboxlike/PF12937_7/0_012_NODE_894_length_1905_cov_129_463558_g673_i08141821